MTYAANDVVLGRHLDTAEKRIKREIDKIAAGGTSIAVFTGATATDGTSGLVPAPQAGDNGKFLRGDGTWATVESGSSGGGYIIGSKVSSVEGGFWQDIYNGVPILKLRHDDYEYNFAYDNLTFAGGASSVLETVTPNTYVLGTASVSNDGGVWYEVDANNIPTLNLHAGSFNYSFNYDSVTYKGSNSNLVAYLPFNVSPTVDACGNVWTDTGNPTIVDGGVNLGSTELLNNTILDSIGSQPWTIDCYCLVDTNVTVNFMSLGFDGKPKYGLYFALNDGKLRIWMGGNNLKGVYDGTTLLTPNTRHHCAMTYDGSSIRGFLDGELQAEITAQGSLEGTFRLMGVSDMKLIFDHLRVFKGQALWTSSFTPPTAEDYL